MSGKQKSKNRIIICVVAVVVLIAAGAAAFLFLMPNSVEGDWELVVNPEVAKATPDEAQTAQKVYYSFSKPGEYGDGKYKTFYDSGIEEGNYKLSEKDGQKMIDMGTGELVYTITGSKLFGGATLTITYPETTDQQTGQKTEAQDYIFKTATAPKYEKGSYASYETDKKLTGAWITDERTLSYAVNELSYTETVKFNDSGIMTIRYESKDLALDRVMYYAYTVKDGKLTFSPVTDKDTKYTVSYSFDKNGNLKFTEDKTSASIFADAFFSDATYKMSESK